MALGLSVLGVLLVKRGDIANGKKSTWHRPVHSIFLVKITAAIFDFYSSGRLGRKRCLYQRASDVQKGRTGVGQWKFVASPSFTVVSNSKSNIAGRINDHELVTLTRSN